MTVVSNTSPLSYLVLIEHVEVLPALFGTVVISETVRDELSHEAAPPVLRQWIASPPSWLVVRPNVEGQDADLMRLDPGERDAIALAEHSRADLVIIDERAARDVARARGLTVTGLLGVLAAASQRGLIDLPEAVDRLRQTSFRASPRLLKDLLERYARE